MNPDFGFGIKDPGLRIQDYGSGLRIWITDYGSGLWHKDRDDFGNDRLKMDQDLSNLYTDNFLCAIQQMTDFGENVPWKKCYCPVILYLFSNKKH